MASSVGKKKTAVIAEKAKQLGFSIVNSGRVRKAERQQKRMQYARKINAPKKEIEVHSAEVKTNA